MKYIALFSLLFILSSCVVVRSNNGKAHRGWFKNSNNPHNPASTNPGQGNGKGRKK